MKNFKSYGSQLNEAVKEYKLALKDVVKTFDSTGKRFMGYGVIADINKTTGFYTVCKDFNANAESSDPHYKVYLPSNQIKKLTETQIAKLATIFIRDYKNLLNEMSFTDLNVMVSDLRIDLADKLAFFPELA